MSRERANRKTLIALAVIPAVMVGMAYAAVPLYDLFCRVTGFAGTTAVAEAGSDLVLDRTIRIRFDASTSQMPWDFEPAQRAMTLRIGETGLAFYEAHNPTDHPITGTATYNVTPYSAGGYFNKIACFCFTEQTLQPGETVQMPVSFFVDPEILDDPEARHAPEITLSYTFYETEPQQAAATD